MHHLGTWVAATLIARALAAHAATAELHLPILVAGGSVYSNVVASASSADRVVIRHTNGLGTVKISGLTARVRDQLTAAGVIRPEESRPKARAGGKLKFLAQSSPRLERGSSRVEADEDVSLAHRVGRKIESEAWAYGTVGSSSNAGRLNSGNSLLWGVVGGLAALYLFRAWCFFRICKPSTGRSALLAFVPLFRWFPLLRAARMTRHCLWVPALALAASLLPPPLPHLPWMSAAYPIFVVALWLATMVLYALWCLRLSAAANRSPWLGVLLFLPVLGWLALCSLAFSAPREVIRIRTPVAANRPALAI